MRAVVQEDIIVAITERGNVEIGDIPKGVGLERLRWDGTKVVDLATLTEMWVRPVSPTFFELHAVPVKGSQLVQMTYRDRHRLKLDRATGRVILLTQAEWEAEQQRRQQRVKDTEMMRKVLRQFAVEMDGATSVDTKIDAIFPNLSPLQRAFLKKLTKSVLLLYKKVEGEED